VPTDRLQQTVSPELVGHRDGVDGLTGCIQGMDGIEDVRVGRLVEVVGPHDARGRSDGLGLEHHRSEQGLLGREVVRRDAAAACPPRGGDIVRHGHVTFPDMACA
jgi:hypothetical protein